MSKTIGTIFLGAGIALLVWGHNVSRSVPAQLHNLFTGSPGKHALQLYFGGAVLLAVGILLVASKRK